MTIFKEAQRRCAYENAMKKKANLQAETVREFLDKVYAKIKHAKEINHVNLCTVTPNPYVWEEAKRELEEKGFTVKYLYNGSPCYAIKW